MKTFIKYGPIVVSVLCLIISIIQMFLQKDFAGWALAFAGWTTVATSKEFES